jgi:flagellar hook assembly protein FlgD
MSDVGSSENGPEDLLPKSSDLKQNYPNPFNPVTMIEYSIPSRTRVNIEIFNVLGQKVQTLVNEMKPAGTYWIEWNGNDDAGRSVSTGVYLYHISAGGVMQTKKMLLLK